MMRLLRRRAISFLLVFLLVGSLFSLPVFAEGEEEALDSPIESANDSSDLDSPIESAGDPVINFDKPDGVVIRNIRFEKVQQITESDIENDRWEFYIEFPCRPEYGSVYFAEGFPIVPSAGKYLITTGVNAPRLLTIEIDGAAPLAQAGETVTLYDAAQFLAFADSVNRGNTYKDVTVKLGADIDISGASDASSFKGIGYYENLNNYTTSVPFSGVFDGDGHSIKLNMYSTTADQALFYYLEEAVVKNVTVKGNIKATNLSGHAAGIALLSYNSTISNCTNEATIEANLAGGIVGYSLYGVVQGFGVPILPGSANLTPYQQSRDYKDHYITETLVTGCINKGTVFASSGLAGGIAITASRVTNSGNEGRVSATSAAAGITATAITSGGTNYRLLNYIIDGCYNTGEIEIRNVNGNALKAAGIATNTININTTNTSITNCYNRGDITNNGASTGAAASTACRVAGIILEYSDDDNAPIVTNCYNTGELSARTLNDGTAAPLIYQIGRNAATNSYTSADTFTASDLGNAFVADSVPNINGGYPILAWQIGSVVLSAETPTISAHPQGAAYTVNTAASALTVTASVSDDGVLSYEWYESTDNSNLTPGDDTKVGTGSTYTPVITVQGTLYYYVVITNTKAGATPETATATSGVAAITVTAPAPFYPPSINSHPFGATYSVDGAATPLAVVVYTGYAGTLSYQWYKSTDNSNSTPGNDTQVGENSSSYTPPTTQAGTFYYYVVVTNTLDGTTASRTSSVAVVTVVEGLLPGTATVTFDLPAGVIARTANLARTEAIAGTGGANFKWIFHLEFPCKEEYVTVTANGSTILPVNAQYTLTGLTENTVVKVVIDGAAPLAAAGQTLTLSNETQFLAFAESVNRGNTYDGVTVKLGADIDLSAASGFAGIGYYDTRNWTSIVPFRGVFDGDGHTVTLAMNGADNQALFIYIDEAEVKNVVVRGSVHTTGGDGYAAAIAVLSFNSTISNCVNYAVITATNGITDVAQLGHAAGIVGLSLYGVAMGTGIPLIPEKTDSTSAYIQSRDYKAHAISETLVTGCLNYGAVTASRFAGGIAVTASRITDCGNEGDITTTTAFAMYAAGITATSLLNENALRYFIDGCYNTGTITNDEGGKGTETAGIAARARNTTITNTYNRGDVFSYSDGAGMGVSSPSLVSGLVVEVDGSIRTLATNCYNAGAVFAKEQEGRVTPTKVYKIGYYTDQDLSGRNCYVPGDVFTAADLGAAFKDGIYGYPVLVWQTETVSDTTYDITFATTPANAAVRVFRDSAHENEAFEADGVFALTTGQYYYEAKLGGYRTENGSFSVQKAAKVIPVSLTQIAAVTITVSPADADVELHKANGGEFVACETREGGTLTYSLKVDEWYSVSANKDGYEPGKPTVFYVTDEGVSKTISLTPAANGDTGSVTTINGGMRITAAGVYKLADNATGIITIATTEAVTILGNGITQADKYANIKIVGEVAGVQLTLQNLYIANSNNAYNALDFTGEGNVLTVEGLNLLENSFGGGGTAALIHVPPSASLTVEGSGALYFYKQGAGAGIGGNDGEANGAITFDGAAIFGKGTNQGALVGTGSGATNAGTITIASGEIHLIGNARGAILGGGSGSTGGTSGGNVYIKGGTVTLNVDFSGAAIGGGGYAEGNDAYGGKVYISGGSLRTFIDYNATDENGDGNHADTLWPGVTVQGVNDIAITAAKVNNNGSQSVYLLPFDTGELSPEALSAASGVFEVRDVSDGGRLLYSGGLHGYNYINEDFPKGSQVDIFNTFDNWVPLSDPHLYLYLTAGEHVLDVNGEEFPVSVGPGPLSLNIDTKVTGGTAVVTPVSGAVQGQWSAHEGDTVGFTVSVTPQSKIDIVSYSYLLSGGATKTVTLTAAGGVYSFDMPDADVTINVKLSDKPVYTVKFDSQGGSAVASKLVEPNMAVGELAAPVRTGYTFKGWYTAKKGGTRIAKTTVVKNNITYYAQWTAKSIKVKHDANKGKNLSVKTKTVTFDSKYGALATATRTGYAFKGWYTAKTGGTKVTKSTTVKNEKDHTLYAQWAAKSYKIKYNVNGGKALKTKSKTVKYGSKYGELAKPSRAGYAFKGWYTARTGGTKIKDTSVVKITKTTTLYAHWEKK